MPVELEMIYVMTCNSTPGRLTRAQKKARKKAAMQSGTFRKHMAHVNDLHYWDMGCQRSRRHMAENIARACENAGWSESYRRSCLRSYFRWKKLYRFDVGAWNRARVFDASRAADFRYL